MLRLMEVTWGEAEKYEYSRQRRIGGTVTDGDRVLKKRDTSRH